MNSQKFSFQIKRIVCAITLLLPVTFALAAGGQTFKTPDEAAYALVEATRSNDSEALQALIGDDSGAIVQDGTDPGVVAMRERFVAAADAVLLIQETSADHANLIIGPSAFIYPVPLVKIDGSWSFDTSAGVEELTDRRIGLNELMTMTVLEQLPDLQAEYESVPRNGTDVRQYAQRFLSSPGKQDGLYWDAAEGEAQSPLGPLLEDTNTEVLTIYYGYEYRMLKKQGAAAPGGAYDYLINGNMIAGYAAIAVPATYGDTGIMTFMINRYGVVYQKDLGEQTATLAAEITSYDPDSSWTLARDEITDVETPDGD